MTNYSRILKLLFKDMFKKKEKKQTTIFVLLAVFYLIMAAMAVLMVVLYSQPFREAGKQVELVTFILFIDFAVTVFFGAIATISYLFLSKDIEFFKTLPVKSSSVFMAKLTVVFLTEAAVSAAILIPSLITAGIFLQLPALFFCLIPIFILCVPVLAMVVISIISLPLMYIISLFKNKGMVSSIAVILLFALVFGLYMYFVTSMNYESTDAEVSYDGLFDISTRLSLIIYPIYMLAKFSALQTVYGLPLWAGMIVELATFLGLLLAMFLFAYFLIMLIYNKATGKFQETSTNKNRKMGSFTYSSQNKTLMKNEWRAIIRNPAVAMQVVSGVLMLPIIVVVFCVMFVNMAQSFVAEEVVGNVDVKSIVWVLCTMTMLMIGVGSNSGAITSISREGNCINYLKAMPLSAQTIINAKRKTYILVQGLSIITGLIAMIVMMIVYQSFVWWVPIGAVAMTFVWLVAMTNLSIYMDLKNPKLNWKSFKEVIKRGKNNVVSLIWIFSSMILSYVFVGLLIAGLIVDAYYLIIIGFAILIGLGAIAAVIFHRKLNKNATLLFSKLNE